MLGDSGQGLDDHNADKNVDSKRHGQEVSVGKKYSIGIWIRGHVCYTLAENLPTFYLCLEVLQEIEIKNCGLIDLVEEMPRLLSIQLFGLLSTRFTRIRQKA